jgi:hypothetical protein
MAAQTCRRLEFQLRSGIAMPAHSSRNGIACSLAFPAMGKLPYWIAKGGPVMKFGAMFVGVVCCGLVAFGSVAEAKPGGCLKYGAAGAVAGHYAGHHGFKGFVLGCVAGIARRRAYYHHQRELKLQQEQQQNQLPSPGGMPSLQPNVPANSM